MLLILQVVLVMRTLRTSYLVSRYQITDCSSIREFLHHHFLFYVWGRRKLLNQLKNIHRVCPQNRIWEPLETYSKTITPPYPMVQCTTIAYSCIHKRSIDFVIVFSKHKQESHTNLNAMVPHSNKRMNSLHKNLPVDCSSSLDLVMCELPIAP